MTVCVAAISCTDRVIGVSDRMLSTAEIAFEPATSKVRSITSAIFAMTAGDAAVQAEILAAVLQDVDTHIQAPGADWLTVKQVADLFLFHWNEVKRRRAESALLAPLGLNSSTFANSPNLEPAIADRIANAIIGYPVPRVEFIVAGVDRTGPHIWVVEDGITRCENGVGFACIGAGRRHAESQMMMGQHHLGSGLPQTLVMAHAAKKRAEVSPSVGEATDMVIFGPQLGQGIFLQHNHVEQLDRDYRRLVTGENRALKKAQLDFEKYLIGLMNTTAVSQQETVEPQTDQPPD